MTGDRMYERLEIWDNGEGMSREEALNILKFGHSEKDGDAIGRYGNGLKAGALNIGRDLLLLTKKNGVLTVVFLSLSFLEALKCEKIYVPCPSIKDGEPYLTDKEKKHLREDRFQDELRFIYKYAPLRNNETLNDLFNRLEGPSGTLLIVGKLLRELSGDLPFKVTPTDIRREGKFVSPQRRSLREYLEILYLYPKMNMTLCGEFVDQRKTVNSWMGRCYVEWPLTNKIEGLRDTVHREEELLQNMRISLVHRRTSIIDHNMCPMPFTSRTGRHKMHAVADDEKDEILNKERMVDELKESYKYHSVKMIMGLEVENRKQNGIHYYVNNRLIVWGHKTPFFNTQTAVGISAYCNLDFIFFPPTATKQQLQYEHDFRWLNKRANEHLQKYHDYLEKIWIGKHLLNNWKCKVTDDGNVWETFWKKYGYTNWSSYSSTRPPFDEQQIKVVEKECGVWIACTSCGSWRKVDATSECRQIPKSDINCALMKKNGITLSCMAPNAESNTDEEARINLAKVDLERVARKTLPLRARRPPPDDIYKNMFWRPQQPPKGKNSASTSSALINVNVGEMDDDIEDKKKVETAIKRHMGEKGYEPSKKSRMESSSTSTSNGYSSKRRSEPSETHTDKKELKLIEAKQQDDQIARMSKTQPPRKIEDLPDADIILREYLKRKQQLAEMENCINELFTNSLRLELGDGQLLKLKIETDLSAPEKLRKVLNEELPRLKKLKGDPTD